jgi:hypothetical protein
VRVVVYGTREVSTRVVVWFEPGMLNVLVLMSVLVSVTTVVNGIVTVERLKEERMIVLVPFLTVTVLVEGEPEGVTKCVISMVLEPLFSVNVLVSTEAIVLSTVVVTKYGTSMILELLFSVTVLVSMEAIVFSTVVVVRCGISTVLVKLFPTTVLVSIEAIVLSTVTVVGSWERVTVLLPRFTTCVEMIV